jgi:uncharacterized protein YecE (DUF72 family)
MLYCGTSGFSYDDWAGIFFPAGLPRGEWLTYYAREFNALELNSTYYALPRTSVIDSMVRRTGRGFMFAVKANQEMTHVRQQGPELFKAFLEVLKPFAEAGKLGCVLAQFPYSFRYSADNLAYLQRFKDLMRDTPLVVEFRNVSWLNDRSLEWLRENNTGFCCVDEPALPKLMPTVAEVTGDIAYLRFHGRNAVKWWQHEEAWQRYDYTYLHEELADWIPKISSMHRLAKNTFIFANNHWRGQAVDTIRQVRSMLDQLVL